MSNPIGTQNAILNSTLSTSQATATETLIPAKRAWFNFTLRDLTNRLAWPTIFQWSWKPTSDELLEETEKQVLRACGIPFEQTLVPAGRHMINTIKAGQGPPLVLLHGFGAASGFWVCNLPILAQNHTVYAIDLPGFGRSSRAPFYGKTVDEAESYFLNSIEEWRKEVKLDGQFALLGHSFGGYLAGVYALRHPEHVKNLILADPWGIPPPPPELETQKVPLRWRFIRYIATAYAPLSVIRWAGPYGPTLIARFRKDIEQKFENVMEDTAIVPKYIYHINAQQPSGEAAFSVLNASLGWAKSPLIDRLPNLHNNIPVALLYGSHTWMSKEAGMAVAQMLGRRATYHEIPHSGHHIYIDNHENFNKRVVEALSRT